MGKIKKGIEIEYQDKEVQGNFGFDTGILPVFFGRMGPEIGKCLYQQKCREIATYCQPQIDDAKRVLGKNRQDSVLLIFDPRDPLGSQLIKLCGIDYGNRELPGLLVFSVDKSWVLRNLHIDIKIRKKLREYQDMGVVVVSYGLTEVVL